MPFLGDVCSLQFTRVYACPITSTCPSPVYLAWILRAAAHEFSNHHLLLVYFTVIVLKVQLYLFLFTCIYTYTHTHTHTHICHAFLWEERKAMPKNAQTTAQLHSSHTLVSNAQNSPSQASAIREP